MITLTIPSTVYHNSQIITGFLRLGQPLTILDESRKSENPYYDLPVVLAEYEGKRIAYDLWDGYQNPVDMARVLADCDVYFKRSFSEEKNQQLFPEYAGKMHPLGFNYHLTCKGNPLNEPFWKAAAKCCTGRMPELYFSPERFEESPKAAENGAKILFLAQLWEDNEAGIDAETKKERQYINATRLEIMRRLRQDFGSQFIGGLVDTPFARQTAGELVLPKQATRRQNYLKRVHQADICIGTMGLFESIGWKTAEYIAAAKGIVNERFHYEVPGNFAEGVNYLSFETPEECVRQVHRLAENPRLLLEMKRANEAYYKAYLKPEVLVANSLEIAKEG